MRTATAEDLPQASPAIVVLSGFIMVCLAVLVLEVGLLTRDHTDSSIEPANTHTQPGVA